MTTAQKRIATLADKPVKGRKPRITKETVQKVRKVFKRPTSQPARTGGEIARPRNLSRFVRFPKYVTLQRQRKILLQRLKVPPGINQFMCRLSPHYAGALFRFMSEYKPLTRAAVAEAAKSGSAPKTGPVLVSGLDKITTLVEQKQAKLVVIACDVEPLEQVLFLPTLCRVKDIPYVIVAGKAILGQMVHRKTAAVLAITDIHKKDAKTFTDLVATARTEFNDNLDVRRKWGGGKIGVKSQHKADRKAAIENEAIAASQKIKAA